MIKILLEHVCGPLVPLFWGGAFDASAILLLNWSSAINCGKSSRVHSHGNAHSVSVEKDTIVIKNVNSSMFHNLFLTLIILGFWTPPKPWRVCS